MNPFSSSQHTNAEGADSPVISRERRRDTVKLNALPRYRRPVRSDYKHWLSYHLPDLNPADIATMEEIETIL